MKMLCIARCVMPVTKEEIFGEMAESTGCGGLEESHQQKTRLSSRPSTAPSRSAPRLAQLGGCPCPLPPQHASRLAPTAARHSSWLLISSAKHCLILMPCLKT